MICRTSDHCPDCRWRVVHEDPAPGIKIPCCHGGPPINVYGDFPRCPEPPYDFCAAFRPKEEKRTHEEDME